MAKRILCIVLAAVMAVTVVAAFVAVHRQNRSGKISSAVAAALTEENRAWIRERYGDCDTLEELIVRVNDEICTEYTYYAPKIILIQRFDFDKFVETKKGLCFDYACYFKMVCCTVFPEAEVYIVDTRKDVTIMHSYNFIVMGDKRYYVDLTTDQYLYNHGKERVIYENIGDESFDDYAARYDETIFNYH